MFSHDKNVKSKSLQKQAILPWQILQLAKSFQLNIASV